MMKFYYIYKVNSNSEFMHEYNTYRRDEQMVDCSSVSLAGAIAKIEGWLGEKCLVHEFLEDSGNKTAYVGNAKDVEAFKKGMAQGETIQFDRLYCIRERQSVI